MTTPKKKGSLLLQIIKTVGQVLVSIFTKK
jgi:hypothetical protein